MEAEVVLEIAEEVETDVQTLIDDAIANGAVLSDKETARFLLKLAAVEKLSESLKQDFLLAIQQHNTF